MVIHFVRTRTGAFILNCFWQGLFIAQAVCRLQSRRVHFPVQRRRPTTFDTHEAVCAHNMCYFCSFLTLVYHYKVQSRGLVSRNINLRSYQIIAKTDVPLHQTLFYRSFFRKLDSAKFGLSFLHPIMHLKPTNFAELLILWKHFPNDIVGCVRRHYNLQDSVKC